MPKKFGWKIKGKYYLQGKCREGNNVKIDHKEIGWDVVQDSFGFV